MAVRGSNTQLLDMLVPTIFTLAFSLANDGMLKSIVLLCSIISVSLAQDVPATSTVVIFQTNSAPTTTVWVTSTQLPSQPQSQKSKSLVDAEDREMLLIGNGIYGFGPQSKEAAIVGIVCTI